MKKFKLTNSTKKLFYNTVEKCGDKVDLYGWRYSKNIGMDDYNPIDTLDEEIQYQFGICLKFLKQFFPRKHHTETISSHDLTKGAQLWWETNNEQPISIYNGVMLVAIIVRGLAPTDLWYSMEQYQQALIPVVNWRNFCEQYDYSTIVNWQNLNKDNGDVDVMKIN